MGFLEHFQEYNQTSEIIFQNIFWNATKHLKIFSFPENIFLSGKYFTSNQTQPKIFSILPPFFILSFFYPYNQMNPRSQLFIHSLIFF